MGPRTLLLAGPRSFCAGVDRAIDIVELALAQRGAPVYVRKQIVHNKHVVADLEKRGAVFVEELDEVPDGATVVFSAHGVSPAVRADAAGRKLDVIDATCPLVSKVHAEARRFAAEGKTIFLIGHEGHEEVEGTAGEAPAAIRLVEDVGQADLVEAPDPERVAYLTQTTLAVDETDEIVDRLRERFPALRGSCIGRHLLRHLEPPARRPRDRARGRRRARRRLRDVIQLQAPRRGRPARRQPARTSSTTRPTST